MIGNFPAVLNFNRLFLKLNRLFVTNCRFFPGLRLRPTKCSPSPEECYGSPLISVHISDLKYLMTLNTQHGILSVVGVTWTNVFACEFFFHDMCIGNVYASMYIHVSMSSPCHNNYYLNIFVIDSCQIDR